MADFTTYLVATDGRDSARRAAQLAMAEAKAHGARLVILHVIDWSGYDLLPVPELAARHQAREGDLAAARRDIVGPLVILAQEAGIIAEPRVAFGDPATTILEVAQEVDAARLFLGRHNAARITDIFLGNIPHDVIRRAVAPVTVTP